MTGTGSTVMYVVLVLAANVSPASTGKAPAPALANGTAAGTFTPESGKSAKLAYAGAFVDQAAEGKPLFIVLSDTQLPVGTWTKHMDISQYRHDQHVFTAVIFSLDKNRKVFLTEHYDAGLSGDRAEYPTQSLGFMFDLKLEQVGKSLTGSAHSNPAAEKASHPVTLDVAFSVAVP
jgi:hypothetical protein